MNVLTLNAGSNSLKFEMVTTEPGSTGTRTGGLFGSSIISGSYDNIGKDGSRFSLKQNAEGDHQQPTEIRDHGHATELLLDWIQRGGARDHGIRNLGDIERIGHRVVHGADVFTGPVSITEDVIRQIEALEDLAPLHNKSAVKVIHAAFVKAQDRVPMIAVVFDTVFHRTIPDEAALYPLPPELARRHRIRRYGFHGISHHYLMMRYAQVRNRPIDELNLITLHLEGGSSAAAIKGGRSIETSMGFTPLEGLMMGTRCGDIDPAIVTYLMRKENMDATRMEQFLNKECGLLGVSGVSQDTRELQQHLSDERVNLAINFFCHRVRKYIGAYLAVLGGAEAIVAGGGISENTSVIRERIFQNLAWSGAILDVQRNRDTIDRESPITSPESSLSVWVIPTQEGLMMAQEVADLAVKNDSRAASKSSASKRDLTAKKGIDMAKSVRDIMTSNPVCLPASTPIREAARQMRENDIGDVVVQKDGKLCGIVTDRDIVVRAVAQAKNPETTNLEEICSKEITSLSPNQSDEDAVRLMRQKSIRRLPVLENGKVVGIVSLGDLAVDKDPGSVLGQVSAAAGNV